MKVAVFLGLWVILGVSSAQESPFAHNILEEFTDVQHLDFDDTRSIARAICEYKGEALRQLFEGGTCTLDSYNNLTFTARHEGGLGINAALFGTFIQSSMSELLASLGGECEGCDGGSVLLRRTGTAWAPINYFDWSLSASCIRFTGRDGLDRLVCLTGELGGPNYFEAISFIKSKLQTQQLLVLGMDVPFCRGVSGNQAFEPKVDLWDRRDIDGDGLRDLVLRARIQPYVRTDRSTAPLPTNGQTCQTLLSYITDSDAVRPQSNDTQQDLFFRFDGNSFIPGPQTQKFIERFRRYP